MKEKNIIVRPDTSWYCDSIKVEKRKKRQLERRWRRTKLNQDRDKYRDQCDHLNKCIALSKENHFSEKIKDCANQKDLYKVIDTLLCRNSTSPLPDHDCATTLANDFATFFTDKITTIRTGFVSEDIPPDCSVTSEDRPFLGTPLEEFTPVTEEEIERMIKEASSKSCSLDPLPTELLKKIIDVLCPIITNIVNMSLANGDVSANLKEALLIPLLKKLFLDLELFKNYRPISNLSFLSKIIEKAVSKQTCTHMTENYLQELLQSAYRQYHSTETTLLKVKDDFMRALDGSKLCLLILLDLSAAFDTIDHSILLSMLSSRYGIRGTALKWFESYLSDRKQTVIVNGKKSEPHSLQYGVPQGSILGPQLFTMYMAPLADVMRKHGVSFHSYADDTQIYLSFHPQSAEEAYRQVENCVDEVAKWMQTNMLKLNQDKTEMLLIGSKQMLKNVPPQLLHVGSTQCESSGSVKNIGVIFDEKLSMREHILATCKSANFHIRNIRRIRKHLTREACEQLVHAFVSSRLDYANAVLYGAPQYLIQKMQRVQNNAARLIVGGRKYDHVTPTLKSLHWLPVRYRVMFKILLITFKALNGKAPKYICDLIEPYEPKRPLRSSAKCLLHVPKCKTRTYGDNCFSVCAPRLWNNLPCELQECTSISLFKKKLKSHLFKLAFE